MGQLVNRVQDIAHVYRCAVIMPEGGSIWDVPSRGGYWGAMEPPFWLASNYR